jgi:Xaa-Pro aminopeptidase
MPISSQEFSHRRQAALAKMEPYSIALLVGSHPQYRNADTEHPFRQNSSFWYFTGFQEPNAVALLIKEASDTRFIVFCAPKNPAEECWTGQRLGPEGVVEILGADEAFPMAELDTRILSYLSHKNTLYTLWGEHPTFERRMQGWLQSMRQAGRRGQSAPTQSIDFRTISEELRLFKSKAEVVCIQKAVDVSLVAHENAMKRCRPGLHEYHLHSELVRTFLDHGLLSTAYMSIVGSGKNGCTLHYVDNNKMLQDGHLVLIDAGAEYRGYAADITRTFPVNGRFSPEQKALYELVLLAQTTAIHALKPGLSWNVIQQTLLNVLVPGLVDLGILTGSMSDILETGTYKKVYMHGSGHWLGLDVHDAGAYKVNHAWRPLEPHMVLTVEPGLYIPADKNIDTCWHNIGIRIEDDILITETGHHVLSQDLVKTVADLEAFMA